MYEERSYRHFIKDNDLVSFTVKVKETDLFIRAEKDLSAEAIRVVGKCRKPLEHYIQSHPLFMHSLEPLQVEDDAADIVRIMALAGQVAGVGPMASVAGAMAEMVGKELLQYSGEIIVENGGDIFLHTAQKRLVGIYAGESPFSGKLALEVRPDMMPAGVCTSSGTVGPSLSLGLADAAIILSHSAALADAAATAVGNIVKSEDDIQAALERGQKIVGILGIVVIQGDRMGAWGDINLIRT
jgi:ApbE superfamily uncharacterized protein (UPF0280 family)